MAEDKCMFTIPPHAPEGSNKESKLNKQLNDYFPNSIHKEAGPRNGANFYYAAIREKEIYKNFLGDWTNPEVLKDLKKQADGDAIFNDEDEPVLYVDPSGNPYIKNAVGDWMYIKPLSKVISSKEFNQIANTLTGDFIVDQSMDLTTHIKTKLTTALNNTKAYLDQEQKYVDAIEDIEIQMMEAERLTEVEERYRKLKLILSDELILSRIKNKLKAKLEKNNYKYTEEVSDKEDEDYVNNINEFDNFTLESNQVSNRAINDPAILKFLSSIPEFKGFKPDINDQMAMNNVEQNYLLNSQMYMNQNDVWGMLEDIFADVLPDSESKDVFENYLLALENEVSNNKNAAMHYIYHYLNTLDQQPDISDPQEFATKLVGAFFKSHQHFLITQVDTKKDHDSGKYFTTFKIVDPGVKNNKITKLANEYIETIINNRKFGPAADYAEFQSKMKEQYKQIHKKTDVRLYEDFILEILNDGMGLNVAPEIVSHFVELHTPEGDLSRLKKLINNLLTEKVQNDQLTKNGVSAQFGEFALFKELVYTNVGDEVRQIIKDRMMADGSFFRALAASAKIFAKDVSENAFVVGGNKRWAYANTSGLDMAVQELRNGEGPLFDRLEERNFIFANHLKNSPEAREMLMVYLNSEIKKERDNSPALHKKITEVDYHLDNYAKMFNSADTHYDETLEKEKGAGSTARKALRNYRNYLMYNFGADKNSLFAIYGLPVPTNEIDAYDVDKRELKREMKEVLDNYVKGELALAQKAAMQIKDYFDFPVDSEARRDFLMKNLIPGYHYNLETYPDGHEKEGQPIRDIEKNDLTAEDFKLGAYHKLGIFSKAVREFTEEADNKALMFLPDVDYPMIDDNFLQEDPITGISPGMGLLMEYVYTDINEGFKKNHKYLSEITLIKRENEDGDKEDVKLFEVGNNINVGNTDTKIFKYIISSFITAYEFSNIFNGHISYYKQKGDISLNEFLKRAPAIATDGKYLRHRDLRNKNKIRFTEEEAQKLYGKTYLDYNDKTQKIYDKDDSTVAAIANNIEIGESSHAKIIQQGTGTNLSFGHEIADAQGVMTPAHFKDILSRIYGWNKHDEQMYKELMDANHKVTDENIKWLKTSNKSQTPLKMVYYALDENGMPVYLKYSLAPLFPAITAGTEMEIILKQMEKQGVEQLVFKSGSKASNHAPTTIHNLNEDGSYAGVKSDLKFNPFIIDSTKLKMQVELPTKLDKDTKLGIQSIKNIMTNIDMRSDDKVYRIWNKKTKKHEMVTGREMYNELQATAVDLLQRGLNKALRRLGHSVDDNMKHTFDTRKVKKLLINELDIETERDLVNLLDTDLPIETVPNLAQRAFPRISAYLTKTAGKLYTNGGSVVQVANIGFDRLTSSKTKGIYFFGNETKLTPPLPVTNAKGQIIYFNEDGDESLTKKKGYHMRVKKAKVLMPFSSIFEKTGLSYNEFIKLHKAGKIDMEIFQNVMGYRIPNQAMSSNDSFEIVGVLPPFAGDQAIVYHEITAKTGSDFDIDKMYLAMSNFKIKRKLKKVPNLAEYMTYKFKSGTDVLDALMSDTEIEKFVIDSGVKIGHDDRPSIEAPIEFILDNYEELYRIAEEGDISLDKKDIKAFKIKSPLDNIPLITLLEDVKRAHADQVGYSSDIKGRLTDKVESIEYIRDNTEKGTQNRLVELMNAVLESPASYNDLMSELDNPMVKNAIHKIQYLKTLSKEERDAYDALDAKEQVKRAKQYAESIKPNAMEEMMPVNLLKSRVDVLEAKTLISIMANNMTDLGESQKTGFRLKYDMGLREGTTLGVMLDRIYMMNEQGNSNMKLSKIVSYLMNASVDAAKDSYIISGNFTSYTANGAMMLTRLGMKPEDLFTITMNDEILNFSRYKNYQKAKLADYNFDYNQKELDQWSMRLINKIHKAGGNVFDVISKDDFIDNNPAKKEDILGFWNLIQEMGKEFNNAVVASKSDSNGAGKNIAEHMALLNRLERLKYDATAGSSEKWFSISHDEGMDEDTDEGIDTTFDPKIQDRPGVKMLGAMANNTLFLMKALSEQLFIETNPRVKTKVNDILAGLGNPLETSPDTIKLIYNYMYPYILYKTGHKIYNINAAEEARLLKEFPATLQKYKNENKDNEFLSHLEISTAKRRNLIKFPNYKNFADSDKEGFKQDIVDMMNETKDPDHKYHGIVDDLIKYAFLTTGTKTTHYSFNDVIPATYYVNSGHGKAIKKFMEALDDNMNYREALTLMAKTHHTNYKIVGNLAKKYDVPIDGVTPVTDPDTLEKIDMGDGNYKPFFKQQKALHMLIHKDSNGLPVYTTIEMIKNREFNTYSFHDTEDGLILDRMPYESAVGNLFANKGLINEEIDNNDTVCP